MASTTQALTAERILEVTEDVLRRHGPAKATVVDVARALGVSHGTVYRHFRTKAALREAVAKRWLDRTSEGLSRFTAEDRAPEARLRDWLAGLFDAKRRKAGDDPDMFAAYMVLVTEADEMVGEHLDELNGQLTAIIGAGVESGDFKAPDPAVAARAVFQAASCFHDPSYAREWQKPGADAEFEALVELVVRGLRS
jgi:AcrR family transcriptional regulator